MLPKYGSIPQYSLEFSDNLKEWNESFKSKTDRTSHLELPNTENVSLSVTIMAFQGIQDCYIVEYLAPLYS